MALRKIVSTVTSNINTKISTTISTNNSAIRTQIMSITTSDFEGKWKGMMKVSDDMELPIIFHVKKVDVDDDAKSTTSFACEMDSPAQQAFGLKGSASFLADKITFAIDNVGSFEAMLPKEVNNDDNDDNNNNVSSINGDEKSNIIKEIEGKWLQSGAVLPLKLSKAEIEGNNDDDDDDKKYARPNRPQQDDAENNITYNIDNDITFKNNTKDGEEITLCGTLFYPKKITKETVDANDDNNNNNNNDHIATIILLAGSGPQSRDQAVGGHLTFHVLAHLLATNGFTVLRYDKRGINKSTGTHTNATISDFADDAIAAMNWIKHDCEYSKVFAKKPIILCGHSEGSLTAFNVVNKLQNKHNTTTTTTTTTTNDDGDNNTLQTPDMVISMGGMGMVGKELLKEQQQLILAASGYSQEYIDIINTYFQDKITSVVDSDLSYDDGLQKLKNDWPQIKSILKSKLEALPNEKENKFDDDNWRFDTVIEPAFKTFKNDWFVDFRQLDPIPSILSSSSLPIPFLIINGSKDLQVPINNLLLIEDAIKSKRINNNNNNNNNNDNNDSVITPVENDLGRVVHYNDSNNSMYNFSTIIFNGMNHLFQKCDDKQVGNVDEYSKIEESFSPIVVNEITNWVNKQLPNFK